MTIKILKILNQSQCQSDDKKDLYHVDVRQFMTILEWDIVCLKNDIYDLVIIFLIHVECSLL